MSDELREAAFLYREFLDNFGTWKTLDATSPIWGYMRTLSDAYLALTVPADVRADAAIVLYEGNAEWPTDTRLESAKRLAYFVASLPGGEVT